MNIHLLHQPPADHGESLGIRHKIRLEFSLTVTLYVTAAELLAFCFTRKRKSCVQCDCKFKCDAADRSRSPYLFPGGNGRPFSQVKRILGSMWLEILCDAGPGRPLPNWTPHRNPAAFLGFTVLVLTQVKMQLGITSDSRCGQPLRGS